MLYSSAHKPNRREHRYGSEVHCRWKQLNQFQSRYRVQLSGIGAADMLDIVVAAKISDSRPPLHQHLPTLRLFLLMFGRASFCGPFEQVQTSKLSAGSRRALDCASSTQSTVAVRVGAFFRGLSRIVRRRKSSLMKPTVSARTGPNRSGRIGARSSAAENSNQALQAVLAERGVKGSSEKSKSRLSLRLLRPRASLPNSSS
jgi:hypothetical protein